MRRAAVAVAVIAALAGAGAGAGAALMWEEGRGDRRVSDIVVPECPDEADCVGGLLIRGQLFDLSCGAVRPGLVEEHPVAAGDYLGRRITVHPLRGVDSSVLMAIDMPAGDFCADENAVPLSRWSMLLPVGADRAQRAAAVCRVAVQEHLERNNCKAVDSQRVGTPASR